MIKVDKPKTPEKLERNKYFLSYYKPCKEIMLIHTFDSDDHIKHIMTSCRFKDMSYNVVIDKIPMKVGNILMPSQDEYFELTAAEYELLMVSEYI